ncbi:(2Fe-2S)-binding protein [Virgibacillus sp. CBA3643]|uniref:(2Fe-2S)-binding protein n=1 Tax=Virgibacillus sp. CBA3643 TaxID=2942278 RepID=UPI0035A35C6C
MNQRIFEHPILGKLEEKKQVTFTFNNNEYTGFENESLAAALLANGIRTLRYHEESGSPRGIYCNIGHCYECRVTIGEKQGQRACLTPLKEGMDVESGCQLLTSVKDWRAEYE